jgi:Tol biopolymer transport system component
MFGQAKSRRALTVIGALALVATAATPGVAEAGSKTVLLGKSSGGDVGNGESVEPSPSKTGRFVAFESVASNLVVDDTNDTRDCFVRDLGTSTTERVSVTSDGAQANGACQGPVVTADGRYVTFAYSSGGLLQNDTNGTWDIFLRDRQLGTTERVSVGLGGEEANGPSEDPAISSDGTLIAFESEASNLVMGDTNGRRDVFVYNRDTGTTTRISVRSNGAQAVNGSSRDADVSGDGRFVVFVSRATGLVPKDTNGTSDIFIHDLVKAKTQRVSVSSSGKQVKGNSVNPIVSASGRIVAFESKARDLVPGDTNGGSDVFVRDRKNGETVRISVSSAGRQASGGSADPFISHSGRYVAFESVASNLVPKDTNGTKDVFLRDLIKKSTEIISLASGGKAANGESEDPTFSEDARYVFFESKASNMVKNDTNAAEDIFRRGPIR